MHRGTGVLPSVTGEGVLIADIDTGLNVFHPAFFHAGTEYFSWLDVDGDGAFTPGVDAVDRNHNGEPDGDETLAFRDRGLFVDTSFAPVLDSDNGVFDRGDLLFADENGDGQRNDGREAGFDDFDPSFGEALFLIDDANENGALDVGEKLVPLTTSKVRAVFDGTSVYTRGENLIDLPGRDGFFENHGTQAMGVAVGGQLGFDSVVGMAPDAEIVMAQYQPVFDQSFAELLMWAIEQEPDIILHEYAPWTGYHLDGSSNYELLLDEAAAAGIIHVNPVGNLGGAQKQASTGTLAGEDVSVGFKVPGLSNSTLRLSLLWREPSRALDVSLRTPSDDLLELGTEGTTIVLDEATLTSYLDISPGGTALFHIEVAGSPESGDWQVVIGDLLSATGSTEVTLLISDDSSSWSGGARFTSHISEAHLVDFPSTADSANGVAAYAGYAQGPITNLPEDAGALREYSGRGRRIDGAQVIRVAAPDNPFAASTERRFNAAQAIGLGDLAAFSGTSGAGAHVAGVAALWAQAEDGIDTTRFRELLAGSEVDAQVTGDGTHSALELWGAGKMRAWQSLHDESPLEGRPPQIAGTDVCIAIGESERIQLQLYDADGDQPRLRWDLDYDGVWDVEATATSELSWPAHEAGIYFAKLQAIDDTARTRTALLRVEVSDTCERDEGADAGPGPSDTGGCGCASSGHARTAALPLALLGFFFLGSARVQRQRRHRDKSRPFPPPRS